MSSYPERLRALQASIQDADTVDLACRLTLIMLALSDWVVGEEWLYKAPLRVLAVAGLVVPGLHRSRLLWAALAVLMVAKTLDNWWLQDNHVFLLTYWVIALAIARHLPAPHQPLRTCARLLLGWAFACATLWKVALSPDFMSGAYFHYTFITDPRFFNLAEILGGADPEILHRNLAAIDRLFTTQATVTELSAPTGVVLLAHVATWWTVCIEATIAIAFLWPPNHGPSRMRDVALLTFAATTYLVASVWTFGWTLLTLGGVSGRSDPASRAGRVRGAAVARAGLRSRPHHWHRRESAWSLRQGHPALRIQQDE